MDWVKWGLAGVLPALQAHAARAADVHPLDIPLRDYLLVLIVSVFGGFVSWFGRVRRGEVAGWSLLNAIGETATSAMAGLLVFWLAKYLNTPELLTIALVGIAGHMGGRAIALLEEWGQRRIGATAERGPR
ncbi:MAG: phage holin family protein [Rubrivivax sp.]|nr:phage holin family protein [Rubrivivax sp.]